MLDGIFASFPLSASESGIIAEERTDRQTRGQPAGKHINSALMAEYKICMSATKSSGIHNKDLCIIRNDEL